MFNKEFYPTPRDVIRKMAGPFQAEISGHRYYSMGGRILDPSAGKGDILDYLHSVCNIRKDYLFAIEIEPQLRDILAAAEYTILGSDFMEFNDPYPFDLIMMNPPFSEGDKHLLKAWNLLTSGKIACVLNAETLRNPHTATRQQVLELVKNHGEVEYIGKAFIDSERKTAVEACIVWLTKEAEERQPLFDASRFETDGNGVEAPKLDNPLASGDLIQSLEASYKRIVQLLHERYASSMEIAKLLQGVNEKDTTSDTRESIEKEIHRVKTVFWTYTFEQTKIADMLTTEARRRFYSLQQRYKAMAFSERNVKELLMSFSMQSEAMLLECVDEVATQAMKYSNDNAIWREFRTGETWKSNKSWRINSRIIIPQYGYGSRRSDFFDDLDLVMSHITGTDRKAETFKGIKETLKALDYGETGYSTFFKLREYKKGTVHLYFSDQAQLDKLNQIASGGKKWVGTGT